MVRTHSIASLAVAWFTIAAPKTDRSKAPAPDCNGPDAPVQAVVDSVKHTVVVTLGPCLIPPSTMPGHGHHDMDNMPMAGDNMPGHNMAMMDHVMAKEDVRVHFRWPASVWVRSFNLTVLDRNHKPMVQYAAIHHMELFNFDRRQVVYPMVERILGIGEETDGVKLPRSVGIPLDAGTDLGLSVRWNNQTDTDMQGVTVQLTLGYTPRNLVPRPTLVLPFKVDVNSHPGGGDAFTLPPGGGSRSTVFTVAASGRLLAVGGHLHDFGKEVRLEDVATGKVLARARASRRPNGEVTGVSHGLYGISRRGPHLIAGRQYRVVAVYEGSPTDSIRGAMGLLGGIFAPDRYSKWPKLDRTNPDYLTDLKPAERAAAQTSDSASVVTADNDDQQSHQHHHGR